MDKQNKKVETPVRKPRAGDGQHGQRPAPRPRPPVQPQDGKKK